MKVVAILLITLSVAFAQIELEEEFLSERDVDMSLGDKQSERGVEWSDKPTEREVLSVRNVTQCIYRPEEKVIHCGGVSGEVECPAIFEWPVSGVPIYKIFGLGVVPEFVDAKTELVRYWLYPRSLDNITYVDHSLVVEGGRKNVVMYYCEKFVEYGFRVTDPKCFGRLIGLIRGSSVERKVPVVGDNSVKTELPMIGEVLVYDKEVSKRWLYGYGFGLGLGGWGYGGLGYGLGYGYPYTGFGAF